MDAALSAFSDKIALLSESKLRDTCMSIFREKQEISRRLTEFENSTTEMALQFQQLKAERDAALRENEELKKQNVHLTQVLSLREQELFGKSSEKISGITSSSDEERKDPLSEDDADQDSEDGAGSDDNDPPNGGSGNHGGRGNGGGKSGGRKERKPKTPRADILAGLPVQIVYQIDIDRLNEIYGEGNWRIANWHAHDQVEYVEPTSYRRQIYTPVVSVGLEHRMITIPWEGYLVFKSYASPSLVARIMMEKFGLYLPLYRQEHDPNHFGFPLNRQSATRWVNICALEYLMPVYEYLCQLLRIQPFQQCDETTWRNLNPGEDAGKTQYMWVHCTSELSDEKRIIVYCYEDSRSAEHLRRFYAGLDDPIHLSCDAYSAYSAFATEMAGLVTLCGCMMHCRRRFADAYRLLPKQTKINQTEESAEWTAIQLIGELYKLDEILKNLTSEERLVQRRCDVKAQLDKFFEFIHGFDVDHPSVTDKMKDAVNYARNQEVSLRQFLTDGCIPIDNGEAERKVKPVALLRKNSLFSNGTDGANAAAIIWTLIETAKAHEANAYYYLKYLLEKMPAHTRPDAKNPPDYLEQMLPWSKEYRDYEKEQQEMVIRSQIPLDQPRPVAPRKGNVRLQSA